MPKKNKKKVYNNLLLFLLIFALAIVYLIYSGTAESKAAAPKDTKAKVDVVSITPKSINVPITYIGSVTTINDVSVLPFISGFVEEVKVTGGQMVKKDDVLVVIQQDQYKAQLDAAKAAQLKAQATYNNKLYYDRSKKAGVPAISKTDLDNAKANFLSSEAELAQAKANYQLAKVNYDYTVIKAPITGVVGNVSLTKGDYISPSSSPLFSIVQFSPIRIAFSITDKDYLNQIYARPNDFLQNETIKLRLANGEMFEKNGEFKYMDNKINANTNTIAIYADFDNENKILVPNAYVDVMVEKTFKNAVSINKKAVKYKADGYFVSVIDNNKINEVKVDILASTATDYIVKNNFGSAEYIIMDSFFRAEPNQKISLNILDNKEK